MANLIYPALSMKSNIKFTTVVTPCKITAISFEKSCDKILQEIRPTITVTTNKNDQNETAENFV